MLDIEMIYNPYTVNTEITINGKSINSQTSQLKYIEDKRLQEWMEPKGSWPGIFQSLRDNCGSDEICIEFVGTKNDFYDLEYAKENYGNCFKTIELIHKNKAAADDISPYHRMEELKKLYQELQDGPVEELKTPDIQKNFDNAVNSDFRIVIVAPMSSGKSTLINAIVGKDLLPAVNQATTAVITEIKDNDEFDDFIVSATDKYGEVVVKDEKATKKLISELNYKKDPKDEEKKEALIHLVQIEGPIHSLPSKELNTIFVDTPGGNNSQNIEHEEMMDEAINDENKSLILYVFNGAQLGTNDSNIILNKISNAMKNSMNGKQSRDRFLFVANRMDEYDTEIETYEDVIENTILPQLASNGITEPKLFLTSAQTAKLVRMVQNKEKLSEKEEDDEEMLVKRFNRLSSRSLPKYASISANTKAELLNRAKIGSEKCKETDSRKEADRLRLQVAEINSGIPAIEEAIKEYLEKYAIAIKIKSVHDTFMKKVEERNMINNCAQEWASSEEEFKAIKKEIYKKKEEFSKKKKLNEFKKKVDDISFNKKQIEAKRKDIQRQILGLNNRAPKNIEIEKAQSVINSFKSEVDKMGMKTQNELDNILNNSVKKTCEKIVKEYSNYINELDAEGLLNFGSFDIKRTVDFSKLKIASANDILNDEKYIIEKNVKIGTEKKKEKGFLAALKRFWYSFSDSDKGYVYEDVFKKQKYIQFKELIQSPLTELQNECDEVIKSAITNTITEINLLKKVTNENLDGIDKMISDLAEELNNKLTTRNDLKKVVENNKYKKEWLEDFTRKVESLLEI